MRNLWPVLAITLQFSCTAAWAGPQPIDLGNAASFAVLAGSTVTNTGPSVVTGDLGLWPGTSVTGFPAGLILNGQAYIDDTVAMGAQAAAAAAFTAAAGETGAVSLTGQDLDGMTLTPGVYRFSSSADLTGTLTLNAEDSQNAIFVFQVGSTLTTAASSLVSLVNGHHDTIIWEVGSSATLGAGSAFSGEILALTSITLGTGAAISCGAAVALTGAVTMDSNSVSTTGAACGADGAPIGEPSTLFILGAVCLLPILAASRRRGSPVG
jgi:hypothetical protein